MKSPIDFNNVLSNRISAIGLANDNTDRKDNSPFWDRDNVFELQ